MYRWCAYCQRYLGEQAPFDDHVLTHGICEGCDQRNSLGDVALVDGIRPIAAFYSDVMSIARTGEQPAVTDVLNRGFALGLRPLDLLIGVLQPTLYEVGKLWERGELTPQQEAAFSSFCDRVIDRLVTAQAMRAPRCQGPLVLVMNAHWNRHTLGLRMAAFLMRERGVNAEELLPTPPLDLLREVLVARRPDVVGVSLATDWQAAFLDALLDIASTLQVEPRIVAGGAAVRAGCPLPAGVEDWAAFEVSSRQTL